MNKGARRAFGIVESGNQALAINDIRQMGLYHQVYEAWNERRARKERAD